MTEDPLVTDIQRALSTLADQGDTDAMAAWLAGRGIRGRAKSRFHCPVARYVATETGARVQIEDESWDTRGSDLSYRWGGLPDEVVDLVREIDDGVHPMLLDSVVTNGQTG